MRPDDGRNGDPFAGTATHYARSRPDYGEAAIAHLDERFGLDGARVLDLGCGAGQLAVPVAARAESVVAMDPNAAMCRATRERARAAGRVQSGTVETTVGSDADLRDGSIEEIAPLDLTTMGRSFHWMDERATLDCLRAHTASGGGVAIVDDVEWLTAGDEPWMETVYAVVDRAVDDLPERYDPASVEYDEPWDELLVERGFDDVETAEFDVEREWTIEQVVDYVLSLSFPSPSAFGEDRNAFERELRDRLAAAGDGGSLEQTATVSVLSGYA